MIQMAAFDVAGTTVNDNGIVLSAFQRAFSKALPTLWEANKDEWTQYAIETMGQSKIRVFTHILKDVELAKTANRLFEEAYLELVAEGGVTAIDGAEELFSEFLSRDIPVVLTTGFSRATLDAILERLGWRDTISLSVVPEEAGEGRPSPAMLRFAAEKLGVTSPEQCIVVGDTESDMQAAVSFGAEFRVGVLSGAHSAQQLAAAGASDVINSVAELEHLLFG